jgi:hypothetical protein
MSFFPGLRKKSVNLLQPWQPGAGATDVGDDDAEDMEAAKSCST